MTETSSELIARLYQRSTVAPMSEVWIPISIDERDRLLALAARAESLEAAINEVRRIAGAVIIEYGPEVTTPISSGGIRDVVVTPDSKTQDIEP